MSENRGDFIIAIRSALLKKGTKQKFSLFFLISVSIIILILDNLAFKFTKITRSILNDGIYIVSSSASSPIKGMNYTKNLIISHFYVYEENKSLKKELEELRNKQFNLEYLITENKSLKNIIDTNNVDELNLVLSKVILDKDSPFLKSVIINRGRKHGIKIGMPVTHSNYLSGRIIEVNYLSSRVLLLNDLNSKIPVIIEPTGAQAILSGRNTNKPVLDYLPEGFNPKIGNNVYTSGKDGFFDSGIPIGKIEKKLEDDVFVKLYSDPNQLLFVTVNLKLPEEVKDIK